MKTLSLLGALACAFAPAAFAADEVSLSLPAERPLVAGSFSKVAVHQVMFIHRKEVQQCYEAQRRSKPGIAGKVIAQFQIDVTGSVSHARIARSSLANSNVENCILNHLNHWRFPRPAKGPVTVTYPWLLRPPANG